jgi:hypothetical protein|tara:strand:- start:36355 stop:36465 length:111 start_codon:yes stop_codon:yes gene_type:complete
MSEWFISGPAAQLNSMIAQNSGNLRLKHSGLAMYQS